MSKIFSDEIKNVPYPLPEGWRWEKLENLFRVKGGKRLPKGHKFSEKNTGYFYIRVSDFKNGSIDEKNLKQISKEDYNLLKKYIITDKDIYISIAGTIGLIGKIPVKFNNSVLTENAAKLVPINGFIFQDYVIHYLSSPIGQSLLLEKVRKMSQPKLALYQIRNTLIPLPFKNGIPDLEKQKEIVEKIEAIFEKIDKAITLRQKSLEDTKKLFESVLNKIFKEAEEDKENWKWMKLANFCKVQNGYAFKSKDFVDEGIPVIRISDIQNGIVRIDNAKKINMDIKKYEKFLIKKGDILIAMSGATTGKLGIYLLNKPALLNQRVGKFDINIKFIDRNFIFFLLQKISEKILRKSYGMAQPNISGKEIENFKIPVPIKNNQPDLEKQKQIAQYLDNLHDKIKQLEELQKIQLEKFKQLKESILKKAFRGELV